jgi:hypothetical protein
MVSAVQLALADRSSVVWGNIGAMILKTSPRGKRGQRAARAWMDSMRPEPLTLQPAPDGPWPRAYPSGTPERTPAERGPGACENPSLTPETPRPRLQQAAALRPPAPGVRACRTAEWLALKLRVAGGVGHVESINFHREIRARAVLGSYPCPVLRTLR